MIKKTVNAEEFWKYLKHFICDKLKLDKIYYGTTAFGNECLYTEFHSENNPNGKYEVTGVAKVFYTEKYIINKIKLTKICDKRIEKVMLT